MLGRDQRCKHRGISDLRYIAEMGSEVQTQQRDLLRFIAREGSEVQTQRDLRSIKEREKRCKLREISAA